MIAWLVIFATLVVVHGLSLQMSSTSSKILRRVNKWACVSGCGACCKLGPLSSRPDLPEYLSPGELSQYTSMIGKDDWCVNFDQTNRICKIYEDRPSFCRVEPSKMKEMFHVEEDDIDDFAAFCCREHITDNYGENSIELERFEAVIDSLWEEDENEDKNDGGNEGRVQIVDLSKD